MLARPQIQDLILQFSAIGCFLVGPRVRCPHLGVSFGPAFCRRHVMALSLPLEGRSAHPWYHRRRGIVVRRDPGGATQAARSSDQQPARTVGIGELKSRAYEIVREVSETGRPIDIALGGKTVARLNPARVDETRSPEDRRQAMLDWLQDTEAFAQEVARRWPSSVSSIELIREQRRDL